MTSRPAIYLQDLGICCALGKGKKQVAQALYTAQKSPLDKTRRLLTGRDVIVGEVSLPFSPLPAAYRQWNTRCNLLLQQGLDEIAPFVRRAISKYGSHRIGVVMATSSSGIEEGTRAFQSYLEMGGWPESYLYSQQETAGPSNFAAQYLGVDGPSYTISTACSAGSKIFPTARRFIQSGICDAVIAGGAESLCQLTLNGFDSLELISSEIVNPMSKNRKGITLGEGAAVFLIGKEEGEIELLGDGETSDAYHMSAPDPEGTGARKAIFKALESASLTPSDIGYVNLHGTGTQLNDLAESRCLNQVFGNSLLASSTKPFTGHTLGASGAIESAFLWLSLKNEKDGSIPLPMHIYDGEKDEELHEIKLVQFGERLTAREGKFALMNNSFAFGGSNAVLILGKKVQ